MAEHSPLPRIVHASEIGKVAIFLVSDASSHVYGVERFVNGGFTHV